jgi:hypothetical protein
MKISDKRKAGEILGRGGISQRIIQIATDISEGTYKNAIEKAGQIYELVEAASYDEYWAEKETKGRMFETTVLTDLKNGDIKRDKVICCPNPYDA